MNVARSYFLASTLLLAVVGNSAQAAAASPSSSSVVSTPDTYFGGQDLSAYLDWVDHTLQDHYPSTAYIPSSDDPTLGAALHWKIYNDTSEPYLELAVAVKASGWLGFGLTINGGMTGADVVIVEAAHPTVARDSFVTDVRYPQQDDCQDWTVVNFTQAEPFLMVQLSRKLNTGDTQDLPIVDDSNSAMPVSRVVAAWGDTPAFAFHGPHRARGALRWFSAGELEQDTFDAKMQAQSEGNFVVGATNHAIPSMNVTEYAYFCTSRAELVAQGINMDQGVTLIGFNPIINNTQHLHHFILYALFEDLPNGTTADTCNEMTSGGTGSITYIWAPGEPPFSFPDNIGFELGGAQGYQSFVLQVHYDNSALDTNQFDSSGVDIYYSSQPREHTAGFLVVGDSTVALAGQTIQRGLTDYSFHCPGTCSAAAVVTEPVTALREYLHMHKSGYSAYTDQIRNGSVVQRASIEYYDFDQTGGPSPQLEPFAILPGDAFQMKCYYNNDNTTRTFGFGSDNEMCMTFILYYPRKTFDLGTVTIPWMCGVGFANFGLEVCDTNWTSQVLESSAGLNRTFGTPEDTCPAEGSTNGTNGGGNTGGTSGAWSGTMSTGVVATVLTTMLAHVML